MDEKLLTSYSDSNIVSFLAAITASNRIIGDVITHK
jgi:hypothetical protein